MRVIKSLTKKQKEFIDRLVSQMTLEEKVGQLNQLAPSALGGFTLSKEEQQKLLKAGRLTEDDIKLTQNAAESFKEQEIGVREGKIGSVLGLIDRGDIMHLQHIAVEQSRLKIPLLFGFDVIHGHRIVGPIPLAESCSFDDEMWEKNASLAAKEAAADGLNWTFAPMVDIARDARWGRIAEGAGEDTYLGRRCAAARVKGFQGNDPSDRDRVAACAKHFVAYGAAESGRDYNTVDMSEQRLHETYLPPFKEAVDAGVMTVMAAFNDFCGVPCTENSHLLKEILREELGFDGFVVSDATAILELVAHRSASNLEEASEHALNSGVDMDMNSRGYTAFLSRLVKEGRVSEKDLDRAVKNVLSVKMRLGLFERPFDRISWDEIDLSEHRDAARKAACESAVLLKNNGALPLSPDGEIFLVGAFADDGPQMLGTWSIAADRTRAVSIKKGFENANINFTYLPVCAPRGKINSDQLEKVIKSSVKTVVAVVGEPEELSGEGASLSNIDLSGEQNAMIKALKQAGKTVVTVLVNGRPMAITDAAEQSDALLELWNAGTEAGNACADLLFGKVNPCGRLTVTFPHFSGECPIYYNHPSTGRPASETFYSARFADAPVEPLFPFGFGLSYTEFEYSDLEITEEQECIRAAVRVKNSGERGGKEVVQLYVSDLVAERVRPVKELKNFIKIELAPGEEKRVSLTVQKSELAYYHRNMKKYADSGEFLIQMGHDSTDLLSKRIYLEF